MRAPRTRTELPITGSGKPPAPRIVRRERPGDGARFSWSMLNPVALWAAIRPHLGLGGGAAPEPINSPAALGRFLDSRAAFVAQTSLYGYLRTRAGMRYPELFDDDAYIVSINIAKWQLWLDCLADLAVHAGSRLAQQSPRQLPAVAALMSAVVDEVLARTGTPGDAGPEFVAPDGQADPDHGHPPAAVGHGVRRSRPDGRHGTEHVAHDLNLRVRARHLGPAGSQLGA